MKLLFSIMSMVLFCGVIHISLSAQDHDSGKDATLILSTNKLEPYFPTYLGNGHFSLSSSKSGISPVESYMVKIFDHGNDDIPRIASLPAWNVIDLFNGKKWLGKAELSRNSLQDYQQTLNMGEAALMTRYTWVDGDRRIEVEVISFVSQADKNLAAMQFKITPRFSGEIRVSFSLQAQQKPRRQPFAKLEKIEAGKPGAWPEFWYAGYMVVHGTSARAGTEDGLLWLTSRAEGRPANTVAQTAAIAWPKDLSQFSASTQVTEDTSALTLTFHAEKDKPLIFHKYVGIVSSHDAVDPLNRSVQVAENGYARGFDDLFDEHKRRWRHLWETDILVEENPELQRLIHSMIFYLLCSIGEDSNFSIPPMGLATAGYYGHIFWDADTYMFPTLLLMHPEMARSMVMYRYHTLEAAKINAERQGYKGAKYPWEADELGYETIPYFAIQNALYEIHITGDVALAQWQYFLATADTAWLAQYGYPVIKETADFWIDRVSYNEQEDRFEINNVVSVEEDLIGIDNDTYTNAIAKINLELAATTSKLLHKEANPQWAAVAEKMYIPYDSVNAYHPTYAGAPPQLKGAVVPLLTYPLEFPMPLEAKRNNFNFATQRDLKQWSGVLMGVNFYPIIAVELRDVETLDAIFPEVYLKYLRPPFNVLAETPTNNSINFITGAGAFLQQFLFGYTGLRMRPEGLQPLHKSLLPADFSKMTIKNIKFRGKTYDVIVQDDQLQMIEK